LIEVDLIKYMFKHRHIPIDSPWCFSFLEYGGGELVSMMAEKQNWVVRSVMDSFSRIAAAILIALFLNDSE
jgi:hypothetical protein